MGGRVIDGPYGFGANGYLLFLLLAPIAAAVVGWWVAWRRDARAAFGGLPREGARSRARLMVAPALLIAAMAFAAFAAARPQYGERKVTAEQKGIDLAIVLDLSSSMLATDARPSRLGRSQAEIGALLDRLEGDRVGLVIFGRDSFVRWPLTSDLRALHEIVDGVDKERGLVHPGSDLGAAIAGAQVMLKAGQSQSKVMLIVTDGEDHGASVSPALADARSAGIRVYTAGAGTSEGAPVLDVDVNGAVSPRISESGAVVLTKLDAAALQTIAQNGRGRYVSMSGDDRALAGLAAEFDSLATTSFGTAPARQLDERFQIFALIALLLAIVEMLLPLVRRPRAAARAAAQTAVRMLPIAGAGLLVAAVCSASVAEVNRRGNEAYARGDFDASISSYKTAEAMDASRAELYHNAGNAYDSKGEYDKAIDETKRAPKASADVTSGDLAAKLQYALGNHYAGAQRLLDALEAYKRSLLEEPSDQDAKHNLEVIIARLSPTPSPTRVNRELTPTPNPEEGTPSDSVEGTPEAGGGSATPNASSDDGTPISNDRELTAEEVAAQLEEALRGIDQEFSEEEALKVLQLLAEQNKRAVEGLAGNGGSGGLPDY